MNFNQFQQECKRTANPGISWGQANLNWALGIAGEAGEYCEIIKKYEFHQKEFSMDEAKKELGDILYYVAMAAANLGIKLDDVAEANVAKLRSRYPNGFVGGGGIRETKQLTACGNNDHEDDGN